MVERAVVKTPGEDGPLNNAGRDDPNDVALKRERQLQATAIAATGGEGEIAPTVKADNGPAMQERTIAGKKVIVRTGSKQRDELSEKYGHESKLPDGTQVNKDGTVFEGVGKPYGTIGSILTDSGWLVGRIIPLEDEQAPSKKKAA